MNELSPVEETLLARARNDGMIAFPEGPARVVEQTFRILESLGRRGYVRYIKNQTWYRAYWLTNKGWQVARAIGAFHRRSPAACPTN